MGQLGTCFCRSAGSFGPGCLGTVCAFCAREERGRAPESRQIGSPGRFRSASLSGGLRGGRVGPLPSLACLPAWSPAFWFGASFSVACGWHSPQVLNPDGTDGAKALPSLARVCSGAAPQTPCGVRGDGAEPPGPALKTKRAEPDHPRWGCGQRRTWDPPRTDAGRRPPECRVQEAASMRPGPRGLPSAGMLGHAGCSEATRAPDLPSQDHHPLQERHATDSARIRIAPQSAGVGTIRIRCGGCTTEVHPGD